MEVLNVTYTCKPGRRKDFLEAIISEGIDQACRGEEGNVKYDYYLSTASEDELFLLEKWADEAALEAHWKMPHFARLGDLKAKYVDDVAIDRYQA